MVPYDLKQHSGSLRVAALVKLLCDPQRAIGNRSFLVTDSPEEPDQGRTRGFELRKFYLSAGTCKNAAGVGRLRVGKQGITTSPAVEIRDAGAPLSEVKLRKRREVAREGGTSCLGRPVGGNSSDFDLDQFFGDGSCDLLVAANAGVDMVDVVLVARKIRASQESVRVDQRHFGFQRNAFDRVGDFGKNPERAHVLIKRALVVRSTFVDFSEPVETTGQSEKKKGVLIVDGRRLAITIQGLFDVGGLEFRSFIEKSLPVVFPGCRQVGPMF